MNKQIRRVAFVAMIMFALLLANGTYMMIFRQSSLAAQPQNRRVRDAEFAQNRGDILAAGKTVIAKTEPSKDRFKFQRVYPDGPLYAPVTGFYSYDHARTVLESSYNSQLAGTDDALFVRRLIDLATNKTPEGASVQTTIVPKIQKAAADALGDQKGAVVALDPTTGAVLAMVTSPSYDPNDIASHDIDAANKAYEPAGRRPDRPLANRAAREIYPPGSTFKLVTAAAALADGKKPDSMVDVAEPAAAARHQHVPAQLHQLRRHQDHHHPGAEGLLQHRVREARSGGRRGQAAGARRRSSASTDATWPTSAGVASQFPDKLNEAQLALSSIGQFDVAASPLQMAMVTAAIANDGVLMDPYLVSMVQTSDLKAIQTHKPEVLSTPMTPGDAKALQQMMGIVVSQGTGGNAQTSRRRGRRQDRHRAVRSRAQAVRLVHLVRAAGRSEDRRRRDRGGRRHPAHRHRRRPGGRARSLVPSCRPRYDGDPLRRLQEHAVQRHQTDHRPLTAAPCDEGADQRIAGQSADHSARARDEDARCSADDQRSRSISRSRQVDSREWHGLREDARDD